jgi:cell cycle arrest protein BUB3
VGSWDRNAYLYEIDSDNPERSRLLQKYEHRAPVLDVAFGDNDDVAYTAGLDWTVRKLVTSAREMAKKADFLGYQT